MILQIKKKLDPNSIKIDENLYKNILVYYTEYVTIKDLKSVKVNSVNPLFHIMNKVNGYFEEINWNQYLTLVPINKSKEKIKEYEGLQSKIGDLITSIIKNCDD